jgi:hypothetical protein
MHYTVVVIIMYRVFFSFLSDGLIYKKMHYGIVRIQLLYLLYHEFMQEVV